jgi:hypothetical protein
MQSVLMQSVLMQSVLMQSVLMQSVLMQSVFKCRAFLAWRRGARSLRSGSRRKGRDGALKTDWTKPWHGGATYGDRMAPAMVNRGFERTEAREAVWRKQR